MQDISRQHRNSQSMPQWPQLHTGIEHRDGIFAKVPQATDSYGRYAVTLGWGTSHWLRPEVPKQIKPPSAESIWNCSAELAKKANKDEQSPYFARSQLLQKGLETRKGKWSFRFERVPWENTKKKSLTRVQLCCLTSSLLSTQYRGLHLWKWPHCAESLPALVDFHLIGKNFGVTSMSCASAPCACLLLCPTSFTFSHILSNSKRI